MSIEIDVLNGNESWPIAEPLLDAVWPRDAAGMRPWGDIKWAHADLRVLIDAPEGGSRCWSANRIISHFINRAAGILSPAKSTPSKGIE